MDVQTIAVDGMPRQAPFYFEVHFKIVDGLLPIHFMSV